MIFRGKKGCHCSVRVDRKRKRRVVLMLLFPPPLLQTSLSRVKIYEDVRLILKPETGGSISLLSSFIFVFLDSIRLSLHDSYKNKIKVYLFVPYWPFMQPPCLSHSCLVTPSQKANFLLFGRTSGGLLRSSTHG